MTDGQLPGLKPVSDSVAKLRERVEINEQRKKLTAAQRKLLDDSATIFGEPATKQDAVSLPRELVGGPVATEPKVRFRPETGLGREVRRTAYDPSRSLSFAFGTALPAPYLPFAIPVGIGSVGWVQEIRQTDDPWRTSIVPLSAALIRSVDPVLGPPPGGMSFSILSSQPQPENSDTLLLVLPTAQAQRARRDHAHRAR
jgi:hypothetical protein